MENNMQTLLDEAARQNTPPQPAEPGQPQSAPDTETEMALRLRAQELITQARTIQQVARVDVFSVYNTDVEVRTKILSGEWDFIDVWKSMNATAVPPAPVRSANGGAGTVDVAGMNDAQFEKLNEMLSRGGKVDMRY